MAQKKNLEGYSSSANSFSVLPVEEIMDVTSDMGIILNENEFDTLISLKTLRKLEMIYIINKLKKVRLLKGK